MNDKIADDMYNGQRVVPVRAISGNVATLNEKLAEVVVDTGSGKQRCVAVKQFGGGGGGGGSVDDVQVNGTSVVTDGVANLTASTLASPVRGVSPACTTITASNTTATLVANTTYAHAVSSSGCTYTLTTPTDLTVYSGFILMIDTTNSASIAFQTDDSPATSIVLNGNPTVQTGKRYTVTGQYSVLNNAWELWIIEYSAT